MSQYIVSARKYRPQKFDEVVGQEHVTDTLKNALNRDHMAHALLFCGPRGIGKTTCARILAKALNCENPTEDHEPCNECSMCEAMNESASFNIVELDAASNNSVDNIRSLIDQIRIPPQTGDYRVFIIDEVHMLSSSAFNAFLKTLEEPPSYAVFILATTEKHQILPTILSRCQIYDFKRIQVKEIRDYLQEIAEKEGVEAEQDALHLIAMKADGALRDALSIFDRIVSATGKELTYDDVVDQLNILDYDYYFRMTDALIGEDVPRVYTIFDEVVNQGFQPDHFITGLGSHLRDLLVCQYKETQSILELSDALKDRYIEQAKTIDKNFLIRSLHIINQCDNNYQRAKNKRLHVEMALNHMCFSSRYSDKTISAGETQPSVKSTSPKAEKPAESTTDKHQNKSSASSTEQSESSPNKKKKPKTEEKKQSATEKEQSTESDKKKEKKEKSSAQDQPEQNESTSTEDRKEKKKKKKVPPAERKKKKSSGVPTLGSIDSLKTEAERERKQKEENREEFKQENIEKFIEKWTSDVDNPSTKSAMKASKFKASDNNQIIVLVGSRTDATIIKNDSGLLSTVRSHFMKPELTLNFKLDKKLQEKRQADRPLSPREKLKKAQEENPKVQELQNKLDLEVDD